MAFLVKNAKKNEEKGLDVEKVVELILKVDNMKKPRLSYTVGSDAFWASIVTKLPQETINALIKLGIKLRAK